MIATYKHRLKGAICFSVWFLGIQLSLAANALEHMNLFIGTGYNGHTFPSATVPFGSVAPGPDCSIRGWHAASGYHYDKPTIQGFSQLVHEVGAGKL